MAPRWFTVASLGALLPNVDSKWPRSVVLALERQVSRGLDPSGIT